MGKFRPGNWASRVNRTHVRERTEPGRPFIGTHRKFYKGFRGKARSRKPGQPVNLAHVKRIYYFIGAAAQFARFTWT